MINASTSQPTKRTLVVVTLALRPKVFPSTIVAATVGCDKSTVSRRVKRVGELVDAYNQTDSEAVRDDLALAIESLCDFLAPGLTLEVLRAAHKVEQCRLAEIAHLWASDQPAKVYNEFLKRQKSCTRVASARAFVVMAERHHGRLNPKK